MPRKPLIGVSACTKQIGHHSFHIAGDKYLRAAAIAGVQRIKLAAGSMVPPLGTSSTARPASTTRAGRGAGAGERVVEGAVALGRTRLDTDSLGAIAGAIRPRAGSPLDICLWSCRTGAGNEGATFMSKLAATTGATVAVAFVFNVVVVAVISAADAATLPPCFRRRQPSRCPPPPRCHHRRCAAAAVAVLPPPPPRCRRDAAATTATATTATTACR